MADIEHWVCTNCGTIDGARAGMVCHGPGYTGICGALGETVVEISPGAVKRLRGAVEALRRITPESPYDIDQDCEWCIAHISRPHEPDCEWAKAKAIIDHEGTT